MTRSAAALVLAAVSLAAVSLAAVSLAAVSLAAVSLAAVSLAAVALASTAVARADAIGPVPPPLECPRGARSLVAGRGAHSQGVYCAPALAPAEAGCAEGFRREIVELEIVELPQIRGGHGAPGSGVSGTPLARVEGPCDAPDDAPAISDPFVGLAEPLGRSSGPSITEVPAGCRRIWAWIADPDTRCAPPPAPAPTLPPAPAPSVSSGPARSSGSWGCSAAGPGRAPAVLLALGLAGAATERCARRLWRRRSGRRTFSP